ncbi:fasciclin domain-containing protein [Fodinibius saliphilus]|uniref:fasciclin domain-containing protein n=1 Tax=Fodinibius saliphilus TaxID=1920650 RepID=UPI001108E6D7|nr:fasciclin domain-containing protein [Fodinibius saliphilus]
MEYLRRFITLSVCFVGIMAASELCEAQNIMDKMKQHEQAKHFARAIVETNLDQKLNDSGPYTLFVPSKKVFNSLNEAQKVNKQLILNHIFTGMATERSLKVMKNVTCLSGKKITIKSDSNNKMSVNSFRLLSSNIKASNGVIHIINGVIK